MFGFNKPKKVVVAKPAAAPVSRARVMPRQTAPDSVTPVVESTDIRTFGGVLFQSTPIETQADLARVTFHEVINADAGIAAHLYAVIAVALRTASSKEVILFVDLTKIDPDQLVEVVKHLKKKGFSLTTNGIAQAYVLTGGLVMALSQGHINPAMLRFEKSLQRDPGKNALMEAFVGIVAWAYGQNADDIDWVVDENSAKSQICFKIGGRYVRPPRHLIPTDTVIQMLGIAWQKSQGGSEATFELKTEQQANLMLNLPRGPRAPDGARVRLRWSGMANDRGTVVTTRIQRLGASAMIRSLDDAGYLKPQMDILRRVIHSEGGMIIFAGVVGSGKSTSLAQLIGMLPPDKKIVSFEDPVELEIPFVYQKTITRDLLSTDDKNPAFTAATRALFRSALDALYLGEIRDRETGLVARQIVESGHSVYTTTHARSALGTIDRLASPAIAVPRDVLATPSIMKLMVYQALLPTNCPHCSKSPEEHVLANRLQGRELNEHHKYFDRIERLYGIDRQKYRMRDSDGCQQCQRAELPELNGFAGRTVVSEMIEPDSQMLEYILAQDNIKLERYWRSMASSRFDDANLVGKDTMECAIYKAVRGATDNSGSLFGLIDPREIEPRFRSFETVEVQREQDKLVAARKAGMPLPKADQEPEASPAAVAPSLRTPATAAAFPTSPTHGFQAPATSAAGRPPQQAHVALQPQSARSTPAALEAGSHADGQLQHHPTTSRPEIVLPQALPSERARSTQPQIPGVLTAGFLRDDAAGLNGDNGDESHG